MSLPTSVYVEVWTKTMSDVLVGPMWSYETKLTYSVGSIYCLCCFMDEINY